jgi:hypothetical protein
MIANKHIWVERSDCSLEDSKEFFGYKIFNNIYKRFAPNKIVGLKYMGVV